MQLMSNKSFFFKFPVSVLCSKSDTHSLRDAESTVEAVLFNVHFAKERYSILGGC